MTRAQKKILYWAWSLRYQFSGQWDEFYFPHLAEAVDAVYPPGKKFPLSMLPPEVKRSMDKARRKR